MNYHFLIEMAHKLYWIRPSIVNGERWLWKIVGKPGHVNSPNKSDFKIWRSALLIASFPMLWWDGPCPRLNLPLSNLSRWEDVEKNSLDGVLDLWRYELSLLSTDPSLNGVMNSFCHAPFASTSYASDLSRASASAFPVRVKHDSQSLSDSFRYVLCGMNLP